MTRVAYPIMSINESLYAVKQTANFTYANVYNHMYMIRNYNYIHTEKNHRLT